MRIAYEEWNPKPDSEALVAQANAIIQEYSVQGYSLTLRQLYYQFVARDLIPNTQRSYKNLGTLVGKARMAGMMSWHAIEDRTRNVVRWLGQSGPEEAISDAVSRFNLEKWDRQPNYVEVWIEKEALAGVMERICSELEVPYFSCRGYVSLSEMWSASQRIKRMSKKGKEITILHLGDHDPSGIDMTRDIDDRTGLFSGLWHELTIDRIALNMDQIEEHDPPPNPAKLSDSRAEGYVSEHGYDSWELDALEPSIMEELVREHVEQLRDETLWEEALQEEADAKEVLDLIHDNYDEVADFARSL